MPVHDYQCEYCGAIQEEIKKWNEYTSICSSCGGVSNRVYVNFKGIKHNAPSWLRDVVEVVDKEGGSHCQEFIKHQDNTTYKNWMKGEGLRPIQEGEKLVKPKADTSSIRKKVKEKFRKDNTIEIRGNV